MYAKIQWIDKVHFRARADSGHDVLMDGPESSGGSNRGSRPMELVLIGLGGCASYDVVTILEKSRQKIAGCVTELTAERASTIPQVFETIHLHFVVTGNGLDPEKVARAVSLSADKYCSASRMLEKGGVKISHDFEVRDAPQIS
ncbi:MAG: OsmC family protein [Pseudomonadales bacterium]|nr:OsmC family protein [Pseudomonadales bacterium]